MRGDAVPETGEAVAEVTVVGIPEMAGEDDIVLSGPGAGAAGGYQQERRRGDGA